MERKEACFFFMAYLTWFVAGCLERIEVTSLARRIVNAIVQVSRVVTWYLPGTPEH